MGDKHLELIQKPEAEEISSEAPITGSKRRREKTFWTQDEVCNFIKYGQNVRNSIRMRLYGSE
jgi:hypothetical protein